MSTSKRKEEREKIEWKKETIRYCEWELKRHNILNIVSHKIEFPNNSQERDKNIFKIMNETK